MGAARENGYEAWRMLSISYEPLVGIRRLQELAEMSQLQKKRCNNAAETSMTVVEIVRGKRFIEQIGGSAPPNDTMLGVLWMSMDPSTRTHVARKVDAEEVLNHALREPVMQLTTLVPATTVAKAAPMDIGAIEEAGNQRCRGTSRCRLAEGGTRKLATRRRSPMALDGTVRQQLTFLPSLATGVRFSTRVPDALDGTVR